MSDSLPQPAQSTMTPRQIRVLKISIVVMSVMLVLGLIALVYGMARQASRAVSITPSRTNNAPFDVNITSNTSEVHSVFADQSLLILHFKSDNQERIVSYDPMSGREYGHFIINKRN